MLSEAQRIVMAADELYLGFGLWDAINTVGELIDSGILSNRIGRNIIGELLSRHG